MSMEKGEKLDNSDTDSMTTVNVNMKEFGNPMDYQEPPPAYRQLKQSTTVQVARIVALAAVVIAAMISMSVVLSAWISTTSCQQQLQQQQPMPVLEALLQPEHLRGFMTPSDLDLAESKVKGEEQKKGKERSSEEDSSEEEENGSVTMFRLPLELNLQEHMFERKHRSHMNCVIEKKKAEEIVDEQSKPIPALLGINMTTDPRYLHFTGEKMAISCDSGNDHKQMPERPKPSPTSPPTRRLPLPLPLRELINSALAAAGSNSAPVHIIGPISVQGSAESQQGIHREPFQFQEQRHSPIPPAIQLFHQILEQGQRGHPISSQFQGRDQEEEVQDQQATTNNLHLPPHMIPIILPAEDGGNQGPSAPVGPIFYQAQGQGPFPHPMQRTHIQHLIRPRRSAAPAEEKKRVKRCSCDCACKNHPLQH